MTDIKRRGRPSKFTPEELAQKNRVQALATYHKKKQLKPKYECTYVNSNGNKCNRMGFAEVCGPCRCNLRKRGKYPPSARRQNIHDNIDDLDHFLESEISTI